MKAVYTIDDLRDWREPTIRYAVLGDPVAHSASPAMHNAVLESLGLPERYGRLWIRPDELTEAIRLLPKAGFLGVNLTLPHKTGILPLLDQINPAAARMGAVNTIAIRDGKHTGHNTDGPGIARAIREEFGVEMSAQRVLILGAGGGAGRAIAVQCMIERCPAVRLVNRTEAKAERLAAELGSPGQAVSWTPDALSTALQDTDLIINATALGMKSDDLSPIASSLLSARHLVYDTVYVGQKTPLQRAADLAGARSGNGLSLLLHQGVLALEIWLGQPVPVEVMRRGLLDFIATRSAQS